MKDDEDHFKNKKLPVMEIFGPTVQGEGHLAGVQTHFLRFGGCDYSCTRCDSIHAIDPNYIHHHAEWLNQQSILYRIIALPAHTPWVTLSGGNPAIHNLLHLVNRLKMAQYKLAIETQGTLAPDWIMNLDVVTVSPKSPGMGEKFEPDKFSAFLKKYQLMYGLNVKVVVFDEADLEFAAMINERFVHEFSLTNRFYLSLGNPTVPVLMDGKLVTQLPSWQTKHDHRSALLDRYAELADKITHDRRLANAKFFPQLHVLAWSNSMGR